MTERLKNEDESPNYQPLKILPLAEQSPDTQVYSLDESTVYPESFAGQDSVVFRERNGNTALHVYVLAALEKIIIYAQSVNQAAAYLTKTPFGETVRFRDTDYQLVVAINPITEVGERYFSDHKTETKRVYTRSQFIEGRSLTWVQQATDTDQREIARHCTILFYDRLNEALEKSGVQGIDINPVNVKFAIDETEKIIRLIITDLAKNIGDVRLQEQI